MDRDPPTSGLRRRPRVVVFDVGGVLIDWDPRHLYRKLFDDAAEMEDFLHRVCSPAWNLSLDRGVPFAVGVAERTALHPHLAPLIAAYDQRWEEMVAGIHAETVDLLRALAARDVPLYALTNFSAEKFPVVRARYDFFQLFAGIVVSGEVGAVKPEPAIFRTLVDAYGLDAGECLFIDDSPVNVAGAEAFGMAAERYLSAGDLARCLSAYGLLDLPASHVPLKQRRGLAT
ncbi:MAG: HAD family phosphatase [Rhodospirillales bacterium]